MFGLSLLGFFAGAISVFLMFLILIQRGKGGGLTGALGGMGGQSAFGSKAGDLFTRITVITAIIWMTCCLLIIKVYNFPPSTAEASDPSGEVMGTDDEDAGAGSGITGDGGGDFVGDTPDEGDETSEEGDDTSDDPVIGYGEGQGETSGEGESSDDEDGPVIDPDTGSGEGDRESGEGAEENDDN